MPPVLKNILAVILGFAIGSVVNSMVIKFSGAIIPFPEGFDNSTPEKLTETFHLLENKHMILPWVAHALGTLIGAFWAARFSASKHYFMAMIVGSIFLLGGTYMVYFLKEQPMWFTISDLLLAYLPMAFLGWKISGKPKDTTLTKDTISDHLI